MTGSTMTGSGGSGRGTSGISRTVRRAFVGAARAWRRARVGRELTLSAGHAMVEGLEPRLALSVAPPSLSALESANNPVVRFETNFGVIDLELFQQDAPVTVQNFLNYITSGRYSDTLVHRLGPNFVIQGGGFRYVDGASDPLQNVTTDAPIIRELTGRSNVERTIAMARTNALTSATSQWFINLGDNSTLDPQAGQGGFTVFGRVVQGWDTVTTIAGLNWVNPNDFPAIRELFLNNQEGVPVTADFDVNVGPTQNTLVRVRAASVLKAQGATGFYTSEVVYPDGFRGTTNEEYVRLFNPNNATMTYQLIARYESGADRDRVISQGTIPANAWTSVRLSDFRDASLNIIQSLVPYALVARGSVPTSVTNPVPISAQVARTDFGGFVGETFFNPDAVDDNDLRVWDFARVERSATSREFLTWYNTAGTDATVTATLIRSGAAPITFTFTTEAFRRGGVDLAAANVPAGVYAVRLVSTQPIVAAVSDFDLPAAGVAGLASTPAWSWLGANSGGQTQGRTRGVIADAQIQTGWTSVVSISNPGNTAATVTLSFVRNNLAPGQTAPTQTVTVFANSRTDFNLDAGVLGLAIGERFSISYTSSVGVGVQYTSIDQQGRNQATGVRGDGVATSAASVIPQSVFFADGFTDPGRSNSTEVISVFNPFTDPNVNFTYTVTLSFTDGQTFSTSPTQVGALRRSSINIRDVGTFFGKITLGQQFRNYAISVTGTASGGVLGSTPVRVAGLVQMTRVDSGLVAALTTYGQAIGNVGTLGAGNF